MVKLEGTAVSHGIAAGKVYIYRPSSCIVEEGHFPQEEKEARLAEFDAAVKKAAEELAEVIQKMRETGDDKAEIIEAHLEILEDEEMAEEIHGAIADELLFPDCAVKKVYDKYIALLGNIEDSLFQERVADMRDVSGRILRILQGKKAQDLSALPGPSIIAAHDLLPSDTATMDKRNVLGIVTEIGGMTSHSAILARSYKIPAVLGVPGLLDTLKEGEECILDALEGCIYSSPEVELKQEFEDKRKCYLDSMNKAEHYLEQEGLLSDGQKIEIGLNIGSDQWCEEYRYCDFVGLFRSEFLYMHSSHMPSEEDQYKAYIRVLKHAAGKPVTLRTLDIGGDKTLSYYSLPKEENPFLGKRALRLCFAEPELFKTQLRAALRASAEGRLNLMFPMVGSLEDIRKAREAVEEAKEELRQERVPFDENIKLGIMIEIPSIAEIAELAAKEVDFASVGTNDLTQYLHAADRMNADVCAYYQSFSPSVFRVLRRIAGAFREAGKPLSVCGELGGNPKAAVVLAGMGMTKMSMSGANMAGVKQALSAFALEEAVQIAEAVCGLGSQEEVLEYIGRVFKEKDII